MASIFIRLLYNANGGSGAPGVQREGANPDGTATFKISNYPPSRNGYRFKGWSKSSSATSASYYSGGSITISSDTTLYAVWERVYTLTLSYDANSGSGAPSAQTATSTSAYYKFTVSNTVPSRTGYTFKGWSTSSSATSASYSGGSTITISSNTTLYAVWQIITYTVSYNANGGSGAPSAQTKTYGVDLTLSSTKPSRTGYTFLGWSTSSTATSATYASGGKYTANADATLYAVWQKITYTVSYNANGGSGAPSAQTKTYGVDLTLSSTIPTRSGYDFLGWATSASATSAAYSAGGKYTANAAVTLYAVWSASTSTISANNGTIGSALTITIGRQSTNYTDTITYNFGSATGTIASGSTASSVSWTPPMSIAAQAPNGTSVAGTLTTTTYNGSTLVGSASVNITLSVPESMVPSISSVSLAEAVSEIASQFGVFVKSKSRITVTTSASGVQGSTISSYTVTINGQSLSGSTVTTDYLTSSGSNSYSVKVVDSRGRSATYSGSFTVYDYGVPVVTITSTDRPSSDLTQCTLNYSWRIYDVNDRNTKSVKIEFKTSTASSWTIALDTTALSSYSGSASYTISGLSEGLSYQIRVTVYDYFDSVSYVGTLQPTDNFVIDVDPNDGSIGYHREASGDGIDRYGKPVAFEDMVDVMQRRCYASLSSAGWYRVLTYIAEDSGGAMGGQGLIVDFNIVRATNAENHSITMRCVSGGGVSFTNESSKSNQQYIDKIRYTYNATTLEGYVDIHYTRTSANNVAVYFDVYAMTQKKCKTATSNNLTAIANTPSGETILTEYSFNANGTGDINSNGDITGVNATFSGSLDLIQRRCYGYLSSVGWYRVLSYAGVNTAALRGGQGIEIRVNIQRVGENHSITFRTVGENYAYWTDETSKSGTATFIDKIRWTYSESEAKAYIDVHYNYTQRRSIGVDFEVHSVSQIEQKRVTSSNLVAVADAPSGEIVLTEYKFATNTTHHCHGQLNSAGWYRAIKIANEGRGGVGFVLDINITRSYSNASNEAHTIKLLGCWNNFVFTQEAGRSNMLRVSKIRYTRDSSNNGYVDIYFNSSNFEKVSVDFVPHTQSDYLYEITAESLQSVADAPSGETVLTTYNLFANTDRELYVSNNYVKAHFYAVGNVKTVVFNDFKNIPTGVITTVISPSEMAEFIPTIPLGYDFVAMSSASEHVRLYIDTLGVRAYNYSSNTDVINSFQTVTYV